MLTIRHGVATDTGNVRAQNEDAFFASNTLFAVADGMGGHNAGEVASALTTQLLGALPQGAVSTPEAFVEVVQQINQSIFQAATATTEQRGMGTTLTALAVVANDDSAEPPHMVLANVGDSRAYLLRDSQLRQLSVDHSYVQELVTEGLLTADEARTHPRRNIVTRALGIDFAVSVDSSVIPIIAGDRFMLCSDGLVDEVPPSEIESLCLLQASPVEVANALVAAAKKHLQYQAKQQTTMSRYRLLGRFVRAALCWLVLLCLWCWRSSQYLLLVHEMRAMATSSISTEQQARQK